MNEIKKTLLKNPFTSKLIEAISVFQKSKHSRIKAIESMNGIQQKDRKIFYFGAPTHANLGDLAQGVCIRSWIKKHYPELKYIEIETNAIICPMRSALPKIRKIYNTGDIFIFQSGYTTTDLGGHADEMHRLIINAFPNAKILMMPQTIYFKNKKRRLLTSNIYNSAKNMVFLARDKISFEEAKELFPDIFVTLYPDIVTTLIGSRVYSSKRNGILFCCRDDGEKFYSDKEIESLIKECSVFADVDRTDTTKSENSQDVVKYAKNYINNEIEYYSKYKLIITDRYHGTILSLVAGTPVIVIKTTDHKVITGTDWFKGIYDSHVFVADSLKQAAKLARIIYGKSKDYNLESYFEKEYYDKLPSIFENNIDG